MYIFADKSKRLILGRQGENIVTEIKFPVAHWVAEFGAGAFEVLHRRPKDVDAAPVVTTYEDGCVVWTISEADVQYRGEGNAQLVMRIGDAVAKSEVFTTVTLVSLSESENPPEVWRAWVDQVLAAAADAKDAVTKYPRINAANHWEIWNGGAWVDTGVNANGKDGEDGHTPIITASKQDKTTTVYVDGGQIATINDGKDGTDGEDGHTPIMTGEKVGDVNTVYADGVPLISVEDGAGEEITHDAVINAIGYTPAEENAFTETRDKLDALWKLSEGRVYDIVEQEENGAINPPSGAKYATVEEVRGKTTQESTNGYQLLEDVFPSSSVQISIQKNGSYTYSITTLTEGVYRQAGIERPISFPAGTYTLSANVTGYGGIIFRFLRSNNSTIKEMNVTNTYKKLTVTTDEDSHHIGLVFLGNTSNSVEVGSVTTITDIILESGSTAHPWEPYTGGIASPNPEYPQDIVSVDSFEVKRIGHNLLNPSTEEKGKILNDSGVEVADNTGSYFKQYIPTNGGTKFVVSYKRTSSGTVRLYKYDKDKNLLARTVISPTVDGNNCYQIVTLTDNVQYITLQGNSFASDYQIVRGVEVIPFEPYTVKAERTITPPRPLNKLGSDVYKDYCDIENGLWHYWIKEKQAKFPTKVPERSTSGSTDLYGDIADALTNRKITDASNRNTLGDNVVGIRSTIFHPSKVSDIYSSTNPYEIGLTGGSNFIRVTVPQGYDVSNLGNFDIFYISNTEETDPVADVDLEFLRSLENLPASDNIIVTDNHGRDVSYLVEYIRKLSEVS